MKTAWQILNDITINHCREITETRAIDAMEEYLQQYKDELLEKLDEWIEEEKKHDHRTYSSVAAIKAYKTFKQIIENGK